MAHYKMLLFSIRALVFCKLVRAQFFFSETRHCPCPSPLKANGESPCLCGFCAWQGTQQPPLSVIGLVVSILACDLPLLPPALPILLALLPSHSPLQPKPWALSVAA